MRYFTTQVLPAVLAIAALIAVAYGKWRGWL